MNYGDLVGLKESYARDRVYYLNLIDEKPKREVVPNFAGMMYSNQIGIIVELSDEYSIYYESAYARVLCPSGLGWIPINSLRLIDSVSS